MWEISINRTTGLSNPSFFFGLVFISHAPKCSLLFHSMLFESSSFVRLFNILIMFLTEKSLIKPQPKPPSHFSFQVTVETKQCPLQI